MKPRKSPPPASAPNGNGAKAEPGVPSRAFGSVRFVTPGNSVDSAKASTSDDGARRVHWRLVVVVAVAAANFIVGAVVGAVAGDAGHALYRRVAHIGTDDTSLPTQLSNIISDAAKEGFQQVGNVHNVQFRAGGPQSRVLLLRPIDTGAQVSDQLRIYDVVGNTHPRYKLRFLFQPVPEDRATGPQPVAQKSVRPRAFAIRLRLIRNLDGKPGNEIIADVSEYAVKPIWPRPVYVFWDAATKTFKIHGLISPTTTIESPPGRIVTRSYLTRGDTFTRLLIDRVYTRAITLVDTAGDVASFRAYAVEAYVLKAETLHDPRGITAGGLALTAGYIVRSAGFGTADLLQAVTWHLDLRVNPPKAKASQGKATVIKVGTNWSHLASLLVRSRS